MCCTAPRIAAAAAAAVAVVRVYFSFRSVQSEVGRQSQGNNNQCASWLSTVCLWLQGISRSLIIVQFDCTALWNNRSTAINYIVPVSCHIVMTDHALPSGHTAAVLYYVIIVHCVFGMFTVRCWSSLILVLHDMQCMFLNSYDDQSISAAGDPSLNKINKI